MAMVLLKEGKWERKKFVGTEVGGVNALSKAQHCDDKPILFYTMSSAHWKNNWDSGLWPNWTAGMILQLDSLSKFA